MYSLNELLNDITVDELKKHYRLLHSRMAVTRKAELVSAMEAALAGDHVLKVYESLSKLEKHAVAEAIYAEDLCFDADKLRAKYGSTPEFYKKEEHDYGSRRGEMNLLKVFFYYRRYGSGKMMMPKDVAQRLRQFVKRPAALKVKTMNEPVAEEGLLVVDTEFEAVHCVTALLRLADQGKLKITQKTGMVSKAVSKTVLEKLCIDDYYSEKVAFPTGKYDQVIGNIKPIGWLRMIETASLFKMVGSKSKLTPSGTKMLNSPAHEIILHIWKKWISNTKYDEFNRVEDIKGQNRKGHMTAKPPRRKAVLKALSDCPVGEWVDMKVFSKYMLGSGSGYDFAVSTDEYKLYLCDAQYGHQGYSSYGGWDTLEYRYILAFMFEYAATLGIIDIAYVNPCNALDDYTHQWGAEQLEWLSRFDGLRAFRITNIGAYCLGLANTYQAADHTGNVVISVSPNLTIKIISGELQPQQKLLLETWAKLESESVWRLDPLRARDAIERGQDKQALVEFIESCDEQFIPDTIIGFLKKAESDAQALRNSGEMLLFTCRDSKTCDLIATHKETAKYCMKCGDTQLVVFAEKMEKFRKVIHAMGLGIV